MTVLSALLLFQLKAEPGSGTLQSVIGADVNTVLKPVAAVLTALSLTLHLSSAALCLLHGYLVSDLCGGEEEANRINWFLLDSRSIRHVTITLFCLGVPTYMTALSIYMLLHYQLEAGIASACLLAIGVLVLIGSVLHTMFRASHAASHVELSDAVFENDHGAVTPSTEPNCSNQEEPERRKSRPEIHRQFSYPPVPEPSQQQNVPVPSTNNETDKESHTSAIPRMQRTLSVESGLLHTQTKPWNGVNNEMRTVLAKKSGKDSTLV
ncbi:TM221 protein, partial [Polypterus senegalus]